MSSAWLYSIAVPAARSKILPLPPSRAFCSAVLYTFSNTRGTDTTNVGLNTPNVGTRFLMSLVKPRVTLLVKAATVSARASTWARGRNTSSRSPLTNRSGKLALAPWISESRLACVSWQPLGNPVVPDV